MEYFAFILGLAIGSLIVLIFQYRVTASGELLIDHTDPEKDIYRINVNNLDDLSNCFIPLPHFPYYNLNPPKRELFLINCPAECFVRPFKNFRNIA